MTFSYCGRTPEEFGCAYIPDKNKRSDWMSEYTAIDDDYDAKDGGWYYGCRVKPREFELQMQYDGITREQKENIVRWLDRRTSGELIFDERPTVCYRVRPTKRIEFEDYLSNEYGMELHSGTFTITQTAYDPFGTLKINALGSGDADEPSANMLPTNQMPPAPTASTGTYLVYNPGTEVCGQTIRIAGTAEKGIEIENAETGQMLTLLPFTADITSGVNKYFEIDSERGQIWLVSPTDRTLCFEYHDDGYITQKPSRSMQTARINCGAGSNAISCNDKLFDDGSVGRFVLIRGRWHRIMSVQDARHATISGSEAQAFSGYVKIADMNRIIVRDGHAAESGSTDLTMLEFAYVPKVR